MQVAATEDQIQKSKSNRLGLNKLTAGKPNEVYTGIHICLFEMWFNKNIVSV